MLYSQALYRTPLTLVAQIDYFKSDNLYLKLSGENILFWIKMQHVKKNSKELKKYLAK